MEKIGTRVRDMREMRGMDKKDLSEAAKVAYSTVCAIEYGHIKNPSAITLWQISKGLDVPFSVLVGDVQESRGVLNFLPARYAEALINADFLPYLDMALTMYRQGIDPVALARIVKSIQETVEK